MKNIGWFMGLGILCLSISSFSDNDKPVEPKMKSEKTEKSDIQQNKIDADKNSDFKNNYYFDESQLNNTQKEFLEKKNNIINTDMSNSEKEKKIEKLKEKMIGKK